MRSRSARQGINIWFAWEVSQKDLTAGISPALCKPEVPPASTISTTDVQPPDAVLRIRWTEEQPVEHDRQRAQDNWRRRQGRLPRYGGVYTATQLSVGEHDRLTGWASTTASVVPGPSNRGATPALVADFPRRVLEVAGEWVGRGLVLAAVVLPFLLLLFSSVQPGNSSTIGLGKEAAHGANGSKDEMVVRVPVADNSLACAVQCALDAVGYGPATVEWKGQASVVTTRALSSVEEVGEALVLGQKLDRGAYATSTSVPYERSAINVSLANSSSTEGDVLRDVAAIRDTFSRFLAIEYSSPGYGGEAGAEYHYVPEERRLTVVAPLTVVRNFELSCQEH